MHFLHVSGSLVSTNEQKLRTFVFLWTMSGMLFFESRENAINIMNVRPNYVGHPWLENAFLIFPEDIIT
jgi:hypothetical protein